MQVLVKVRKVRKVPAANRYSGRNKFGELGTLGSPDFALEVADEDRAMKKSLLAVAIAIALATATPLALADTTSNSTSSGGAGGAGGAAAGGAATGGTATNSNNTSGVSNASGGIAQGGQGGVAAGGTSSSQASGGYVGTVSTGGSNASLGDVTVNFNSGSTPMGKAGLGVGVDPTTGHIVTDNSVTYGGSYKVKNTPDVNVGGPASGPCNGFSGGIGVSMAGIGIGANASTVDEGCSARETARVAAMIGRMDVANAVLENLPIVQAAMKAKATREALALPPKADAAATTAPAQWVPAPTPVQTQEQREAALKEQQRLAQEALQRQATMAKVNDTLTFTDASTQGREKTPQQVMAEEANKKLALKAEEANKPPSYAAASPSAPSATPSDVKVASAPVASQQAAKPDATAKMAENKMSPANAMNLSTSPQQSSKIELLSKVEDRTMSSGAPTADERIKAAKAALNLQ